MSGWLYLVACIVSSTVLWPLARWALADGGETRAMGFWACLIAAVWSLAALVGRGASLWVGPVWLAGVVLGVAYSVGFYLLIMRCLQIGPAGPTVTLNNLGLLWPVVIGLIGFSAKAPGVGVWVGLACTILALVLMGARRGARAGGSVTRRWAAWALVGWAFSGISMGSQFLASQRASEAAPG